MIDGNGITKLADFGWSGDLGLHGDNLRETYCGTYEML